MQKFKLLQTVVLIYMVIISSNLWAENVPTYGPIKQGDMLWTIAGKVSPPSIDRHQAILALQRINPRAFSISCNIYSLKIGEMLRIPRLAAMQAVSREQAINELNRQEEEWKERRIKPIICSPVLELSKPEATTQTVGEATTSSQSEPNVPIKTTTHSQTPLITDVNNNQTVTLVSEEELEALKKENVSTPFDELINRTLLISGILFVIFLMAIGGWFFKHRRAEIKAKEKETLAQSTFSEPVDEIPLPVEAKEK